MAGGFVEQIEGGGVAADGLGPAAKHGLQPGRQVLFLAGADDDRHPGRQFRLAVPKGPLGPQQFAEHLGHRRGELSDAPWWKKEEGGRRKEDSVDNFEIAFFPSSFLLRSFLRSGQSRADQIEPGVSGEVPTPGLHRGGRDACSVRWVGFGPQWYCSDQPVASRNAVSRPGRLATFSISGSTPFQIRRGTL